MKTWHFKIQNNAKTISKRLEAALGSVNGFVYNMSQDKNDSISFKIRKRLLYAWYMYFHNNIIVNGKLLKTNTENETDVEINFTQHFFMSLVIFTNIFVGVGFLITILFGERSSIAMYIFGGIFLAIGIVLGITMRKKHERNIQEYKSMISDALGV